MAAVAAERDSASKAVSHDQRLVREAVLQRMLRAIRRFDRLFRLILNEGDRIPELREVIGTALSGLGQSLTWKEHPAEVLLLAALGGYHFSGWSKPNPSRERVRRSSSRLSPHSPTTGIHPRREARSHEHRGDAEEHQPGCETEAVDDLVPRVG